MITNENLGYPTNRKKSKVQEALLIHYEGEKPLSDEERIQNELAADRRRRETERIFGALEIPEKLDEDSFSL